MAEANEVILSTKASSENSEEMYWYAMRVTYRRELKVKDYLDEHGVESYIPMHYVMLTERGRKRRKLEPAIHNLIFIHTSQSTIQQIKQRIDYLQYTINRNGEKIVVPHAQMEQFMSISKVEDESLRFFTPDQLDLTKGDRVRIHGGALDGHEGIFVKIKGIRSKRVVITIPEIAAVAIEVAPDLIEKI